MRYLSVFLRSMMPVFLLGMTTTAVASSSASLELANRVLLSAGTAAVFEQPVVQAALANPAAYLSDNVDNRVKGLLDQAGYKEWHSPRVWLLQAAEKEGKTQWVNVADQVEPVQFRGLRFSRLAPAPTAFDVLNVLAAGKDNSALGSLLNTYEADVLVLLKKGREWTVLGLPFPQQGQLPQGHLDILPDMLAEVMASAWHWPMAAGRTLVPVYGVNNIADFANVQRALQSVAGVRQLKLVQITPDHLLFAVSAPDPQSLDTALSADARFAMMKQQAGLPERLVKARLLAGILAARLWQPDVIPLINVPNNVPEKVNEP